MRRTLLRCAVVGCALAVGSVGPATASFPGSNGRIAFVWAPDGVNADIYSIDELGCGLTRLTEDPGRDLYPVWSPDGSKIVFQHESPGPVQPTLNNWVMAADGTGAVEIGDDTTNDWRAVWSPDGSRLAFRRELEPGRRPTFVTWEIFTVKPDGTGERQLTDDEEPDDEPSWSPDGSRLAFTHREVTGDEFNPAPEEIHVMDAVHGRDRTQLTSNSHRDTAPQWSPTADVIMFMRQVGEQWDIFTIRPDGTGEAQLTNDVLQERDPVWSPDGTQIAFWIANDIFVMNADGSGQRKIGEGVGKYQKFSPDGGKILFSGADETTLRTMNADGSGIRKLIGDRDEPAAGPFADWQAAHGTPPPDTTPPEITALSDYPDPMTPNGDGQNELTYIRYTLSEDADVTVTIVKKGNTIAKVADAVHQCAGPREVVWRGKNNKGRKVASGRFTYKIKAVDAGGNVANARGTITVKR